MQADIIYSPDHDMTDQGWRDNVRDMLPGFMTTNPDSNNQKLLNIISRVGDTYKNDLLKLTHDMNVDNASGQVLTDIAKDYGIDRIDDDDEFLRFEVKFVMWRNHLGAGFDSIKRIISFLFNIDPKDFAIVSTGIKAIKVTNLPFNFSSGDKSDLKREMVAGFIRSITPPEYKLTAVEYQSSANLWIFNGRDTTTPLYIGGTQYVAAETYGTSSVNKFHATQADMFVGSQQLPKIKESVGTFTRHHVKQLRVITATQDRKDQ